MINCHAHIFTIDHVPNRFLPFGLPWLMRNKFIRKPVTWLTDSLWPFSNKDQLSRLSAFIGATYRKTQTKLLEELDNYYPEGTQYVILPMDMEFQGAGRLKAPLEQQLQDIIEIKESMEWKERVFPFVPIDPRRHNILDFLKKYIDDHEFKGVKLYPALGYWACDRRLFPVYEYCELNQIPIITHCSRGGVYFKGHLKQSPELLKHPITGATLQPERNRIFTDRLGDPDQFRYVLDEYPELKIDFAHYGGGDDWLHYLEDPWQKSDSGGEDRDVSANWVHKINNLIRDPKYPNIYTDISYTLHDERIVPLLKMFLNDETLRNHILFGTDYYMLEQDIAEREIAIKFRFWIGEQDFKQLAETNNNRLLII